MSKTPFHRLIDWSRDQFSDLPWRKKRSMYFTLVSEIMLQQTTVATVKNHFERFLVEYPDLKTLANASEEQVLLSWRGLGYYRRARNLHNIAKLVVNEHKGIIPKDQEHLMSIKGIGPYTANALLSIGDDQSYLSIDANLERVLSRIFGIKESKKTILYKKIEELTHNELKEDLKKFKGRAINEALMDLGRVVCQARKADCLLCPLNSICVARKKGNPYDYPFKRDEVKKDKPLKLELLRVLVVEKGNLLGYQKAKGEWLEGQFECPTFIVKSDDKKLSQYPILNYIEDKKLTSYKTAITKYNITNKVLILKASEAKKLNFLKDKKFKYLSMEDVTWSTATLKALKYLE